MVDKSTLDECLVGITFPADSETIVDCCEGNNCSRDVLSQIGELHSETFGSEEELLCSLGDKSYC
jgi:Protein of unknown function (DUF2795)